MSYRTRVLKGICVVAVASGLSACQEEGLAKNELVARGDRICKQTSEKLNPLFQRLFPTGEETPPASEAAPIMNDAAKLIRQEVDSISRLSPRENLRNEFQPIVQGLRESAELTEESARLASEGNTDGYLEKLQEANRADQDVRDLMVEFGFKDCAGATE